MANFNVLICLSFVLHLSVSIVISQNEINSTHFYPIIFNGASVDDINEAKFIVQILHEERLVCAGSLIGPRTVVTAAHCVFNVPINLLDIEYGSIWAHTKRSKNIISVQNVSIHPHYADGNETFADIATIILKEPIKRSPTVNYISLNQDRFIKKNTKVKAYGWGCTYISADRTFEKYPIKLQKTIFDTWTETQCVKIIGGTSKKNDKICVSNSKGGNCFADSGGPLLYNGKLAGIASCSDLNIGGVNQYIKVSSYITFIKLSMIY